MDPEIFPQSKTLYLRAVRNTSAAPRDNPEASDAAIRPAAMSRPTERPTHIRQTPHPPYDTLLHGMHEGVLLVNTDGRVLDANRKACRLFGQEKSNLCGRLLVELLDAVDVPFLHSVGEALASGQPVVVETDARRADGSVFPCEAGVLILAWGREKVFCFFVRDVSTQRQTEEELLAAREELERQNRALQTSEASLRASLNELELRQRELAQERDLLRSILDNTPDRIFIKDCTGRFLRVNEATARFYGLQDPAEAIGKNDFDFFPAEQAAAFFRDDQRVISTGVPIVDKLQRIERTPGTVLWASVTKAPIRDNEGRVMGLVGISRDITERKEAEEKLKAAEKQLEKAKRLEATALFAGQIAHDLNNLLVPLLIYPDIVKKSLDPEGQAYKDLETMQAMAQQIADINQDLMAVARRGKTKTEPVDVNAVIAELASFFQRTRPHERIHFVCEPYAETSCVLFDRPQLTRALQNLLQNALDAIGDHGVITLRTENVSVTGPIGAVPDPVPGQYVRVTVADTGCGIPESVRDRIFEPFFTTKDGQHKQRRGTGLGLSVVYGIVADHGGYLDFESAVGKGTSFYLYLPVTDAFAQSARPSDIQGGDEWILVVEDDPVQTQVLTRALNELGYRVSAVASGEAAVEAVEKGARASPPKLPDLILLDLVLRDTMDGIETFRRIRAISPTVKTVTISGFHLPDKIAEGEALGMSCHLAKPLTVAALARAVREALDVPVITVSRARETEASDSGSAAGDGAQTAAV